MLPACKGIFKMAGQVEEPDLPEEVTESLESFHEALGKVEDVFKPLLETSVDDLKEKVGRFPWRGSKELACIHKLLAIFRLRACVSFENCILHCPFFLGLHLQSIEITGQYQLKLLSKPCTMNNGLL